jgi:predicted ester cyclase
MSANIVQKYREHLVENFSEIPVKRETISDAVCSGKDLKCAFLK